MTVQEIINRAKAEVGTVENPPNSNNVKYNTWYYGRPVSGAAYPWCCVFVAWLFRDEQSLCKKTASCSDLYNWFRARGQLVDNPMPGDLVFFKWDKSIKNPCQHIGVVIDKNGNVKSTVEGNTSITSNDNGGKVMIRQRTSGIVGYARPKYANASKPAATSTEKTEEDYKQVVKKVMRGEYGVQPERQRRLEAEGYNYNKVKDMVNREYGK